MTTLKLRPSPRLWVDEDTVLNPGRTKLKVGITQEKNRGFTIDIAGPEGYRRTLRISSSLKLKKG